VNFLFHQYKQLPLWQLSC